MSDQQKQDTKELATMFEALPKEDRLRVQGVITGLHLARRAAATASGPPERERERSRT